MANSDGGQDVFVQLFTTVADRPVGVEDNVATSEGGGIYLKPFQGFGSQSYSNACLFDFRVDDNSAPEGAAIYLDSDTGSLGGTMPSLAFLNDQDEAFYNDGCGMQPASAFNAIPCSAGTACNEISGNVAHNAQGNPSGAIVFTNGSEIYGDRFRMQGNNAIYAMSGPASGYYLNSCLITDNQLSQNVIFADSDGGDGSYLFLDNCTVAHDVISTGNVIKLGTNAFLTLLDDIIDEVGKPTLDQPGDTVLTASYLMSNDISTLPTSPTIIQYNDFSGDPLFADATNGDYHLVAYIQNNLLHAARAIDFAPTQSGDPPYDLDGKTYGQDVPAVPDLYGTRDLGAYEALPITDRIFGDTFGDRLSLVY